MLLTLSTTHRPATDLGYLLHKNPARAQVFDLSFGKAHVFYPDTSQVAAPGSLPHQLGDFVMAAVRTGFALTDVGEYAPDAGFVRRYPRAASYEGWPMLVVLAVEASARPTRTAIPSPAATPAGSARPGSTGSRSAGPSGC